MNLWLDIRVFFCSLGWGKERIVSTVKETENAYFNCNISIKQRFLGAQELLVCVSVYQGINVISQVVIYSFNIVNYLRRFMLLVNARLMVISWDVQYMAFPNGLRFSWYRAFHRFGQAKFPDGGSVLGSNQFSILPPQLPLKMMLRLKVVKIDSKISNSLC